MDSRAAEQVRQLSFAANAAAQQRRLEEAASLWRQVLQLAPLHPQALLFVGQHSLHTGDPNNARLLLQRATQAAPKEPIAWLNLSFACRALGDQAAEMTALNGALAADPYCYPALLSKGVLQQKMGQIRAAARTYKDVLTILPPEEMVPPEMHGAVARAREVVREELAAFESFVASRLSDVKSELGDAVLDRVDECVGIAAGSKKAYTNHCSVLYFPGLPPLGFHDTKQFPWLKDIEAATDTICEELVALLKEDGAEFAPYVRHPDGVPLNQWTELNHSPRWSAFFLWQDGRRLDAHCERCPKTAAALETLPMATMPGYAPTAFFSTLEPRTRIPPHTGATNARLIVHVPLIVPPKCGFRVANETRIWEPGHAFVFDDTIEHEAWNESDRLRAILIFDIWNPYIAPAEREMVNALLLAMREYYGADAAQSF